MLINDIWVYGGLALASLICAATYWWGGPTERVGAATVWIAWVLSLLLSMSGPKGPGMSIIMIDVVCLVVFLALSLRTRRLWTLFAAACQLDDVMSHFAAKLTHFQIYSYVVAIGLWGGEAILVCLIAGAIGYQRRLREQKLSGVETPRLRLFQLRDR